MINVDASRLAEGYRRRRSEAEGVALPQARR